MSTYVSIFTIYVILIIPEFQREVRVITVCVLLEIYVNYSAYSNLFSWTNQQPYLRTSWSYGLKVTIQINFYNKLCNCIHCASLATHMSSEWRLTIYWLAIYDKIPRHHLDIYLLGPSINWLWLQLCTHIVLLYFAYAENESTYIFLVENNIALNQYHENFTYKTRLFVHHSKIT